MKWYLKHNEPSELNKLGKIMLTMNLTLKGTWLLSALLIPIRLYCWAYSLFLRLSGRRPIVIKIFIDVDNKGSVESFYDKKLLGEIQRNGNNSNQPD